VFRLYVAQRLRQLGISAVVGQQALGRLPYGSSGRGDSGLFISS
jgi:hypothetical protein